MEFCIHSIPWTSFKFFLQTVGIEKALFVLPLLLPPYCMSCLQLLCGCVLSVPSPSRSRIHNFISSDKHLYKEFILTRIKGTLKESRFFFFNQFTARKAICFYLYRVVGQWNFWSVGPSVGPSVSPSVSQYKLTLIFF